MYVSVNKALVTQVSSAIPVIPLYMSILFKVMKNKKIHEGCIEQIQRLFKNHLYVEAPKLDVKGRIRIDDLEMRDNVQKEVYELWDKVTDENLHELTDIDGYREDFYKLFGFKVVGVDYQEDVNEMVAIPSIF